MKWLTLLPMILLLACHAVTKETIEPMKVMVTSIHQQPTVPFFGDSPVDVTNTRIRTNYGE